MAAGKKFKFQGSTIAVLTGFAGQSPNPTISAITNSSPPVVTSTGHGLQDGDIVKITDVQGMTELNDEVFVVIDADPNEFSLADVDATGYGTYTGGGIIDVGVLSNFCELTGYNRQGAAKPELPATSLCSTAAEFVLGLPDFGTTQFDYNFAPETAIQKAIAEFDRSGDTFAVSVKLPNNGGHMVQLGFISQTSEQAAVNGLWTGSMTMRNSGPRVDIEDEA